MIILERWASTSYPVFILISGNEILVIMKDFNSSHLSPEAIPGFLQYQLSCFHFNQLTPISFYWKPILLFTDSSLLLLAYLSFSGCPYFSDFLQEVFIVESRLIFRILTIFPLGLCIFEWNPYAAIRDQLFVLTAFHFHRIILDSICWPQQDLKLSHHFSLSSHYICVSILQTLDFIH